MNPEIFDNLFEKYLAGECTPEELDVFFQYIQDPDHEQHIISLINKQDREGERMTLDFEKKMHIAFKKTDIYLNKEIEPKKHVSNFNKFPMWLAYVAACVLLFGVAFFTWKKWEALSIPELPVSGTTNNINYQGILTMPNGEELLLESTISSPKVLLKKAGIQLVQQKGHRLEIIGRANGNVSNGLFHLEVAKGKRLELKLSDGSLVTLNATSQFSFPLEFDHKERKTELSGEGYFEIAHDAKHPFSVQTATQLVEVYGTKFNVREYPNDSTASTALFSGKVSVRKRYGSNYGKADFLTPGKQLTLSKRGTVNEEGIIHSEKDVKGWITGKRYYSGVDLSIILRDLTHDFDFSVDWDNIPKLRFQGAIPQGYTLEQILELINQSANIKLVEKDSLITIQK